MVVRRGRGVTPGVTGQGTDRLTGVDSKHGCESGTGRHSWSDGPGHGRIAAGIEMGEMAAGGASLLE